MDNAEDVLGEIVEEIVHEVSPERIYVFGSRARGDARPDSDLDLLVVEQGEFGPERSRRHEMSRLWRRLAQFRMPKDILVFSVDEVERWRGARNHVIARALREGRLVYDRQGRGERASAGG